MRASSHLDPVRNGGLKGCEAWSGEVNGCLKVRIYDDVQLQGESLPPSRWTYGYEN